MAYYQGNAGTVRLAVFDTNVVVSGMLSPHGPPGRIVDRLRSGTLTAVLNDCIVAEYAEALMKPTKSGLPDWQPNSAFGFRDEKVESSRPSRRERTRQNPH